MKKMLKNILKVVITLVIALCICVTLGGTKSNADAGSHTSHSSSSSSRSSSRSSSSRSSSSRSSSSSSSGSSSMSGGEAVVTLIILVIIVIIIISANKKGNIATVNNVKKLVNNQDVIKQIKELIPNFDEKEFLQKGYNIFLDIEKAWMNFELDKVHNIMTDEMFNMYEAQLSTFEIKGEQNVMKDFKLVDSAITGLVKQNDNIEIKTQYIVEFFDYIIDKETGKVLRGNSRSKVRMHYEFTFIMNNSEESKIDKCPNCGAKVDVNSAGTCEYCASKIVGENTEWVISKKICLRQTNL